MYNLKEYLEMCKASYYKGEPIISDSQYDHLEELCQEELGVGTNRGRVKHWWRLYSLQKYYLDEDVVPLGEGQYKVTPKLDGAAIAIRYVAGWFNSVVTRGNGEYGEDITHLFTPENLEKLGIPSFLEYSCPAQVVGEIVAPKYIDNARNYAAGALNLQDPSEFWCRELQFFPYDILDVDRPFYSDNLSYLNKLGFQNSIVSKDTNAYPQDGTVHRLEDNKKYYELGFTSKHPRGAYAVKERSEGIMTTILNVIWETGKSGKVTPVAILEPVNIDGARVSRATLNNPGFIEALGVSIGDQVFVERAGGIIPRIIRKVND